MKNLPSVVQQIIRRRLMIRQRNERRQRELIDKADIYHDQIRSKILTLGIREDEWTETIDKGDFLEVHTRRSSKYGWLWNFFKCGEDEIIRQCSCCGERKSFRIGCSQKFCPRCAWKISKVRERKIKAWASRVRQPLHMVLTQRNFQVLTRSKLRSHIKNLAAIRRQKFFRHVKGGCITVEITNEGRGWHLHSHWLVDAHFIAADELSVAWGKLVGQEFAIVKVKKIGDTSYLHELCKYVAKGNEVATWPAEQIWEFATAIRNRRFFFSFGSLTKLSREIKVQIHDSTPEKKSCDCGASEFTFRPADHRDKNP